MLLDVLIVLGELLHQAGRGVEVADHFALVGLEALLHFVQLVLDAAGGSARQQAGEQKTDGNPDNQGQGWQQPGSK
ncbi:hypothetical protein D3C78_1399150 [compost metagenome]